MATIPQLRDALEAALLTVPGLRASSVVLDSISPPIAVVGPPGIAYDMAMAQGASRYTFPIRVYASRASEKAGQDRLDAYLSPTGTGSVKAAIEADPSLGGAAMTVRVTQAQGYGVYEVAGIPYIGAEFTVDVIA